MGLRLLIGRTGFGKTKFCIDEIIKKSTKQQEKQILICPEQFTSEMERTLLLSSKHHAQLYGEVLSFGRIAFRMFSEFGIGQREILDDLGKIMTLQKVALQKKDTLIYFQNMVDKYGFIEQLSLTFSEFAKYGIHPRTIYEKKEEGGLPQSMQEKLHDLALLHEGYNEAMANEYLPKDERLTVLSDLLGKYSAFTNTEFYIDGFYGFTPQEMNVISGLLQSAVDITITLPLDETTYHMSHLPYQSPFFEAFTTKEQLLELAKNTNITVHAPIFLQENHRAKTSGLQNLETYYFQSYHTQCKLSDAVKIYRCTTKESEIEFIAGSIKGMVRRKNLRYQDIAILTNALDSYEKPLRATFREFDLPCFIDKNQEISSHPLIGLLLALLQIMAYGFTYEHLFAYLKSGLTNLKMEEVDILENYVLAYGIKEYHWSNNKPFRAGQKKEGEDLLLYINELRERCLTPFLPLLEWKKKKTVTMESVLDFVMAHLTELSIDDKMTIWRTFAFDSGEVALAETHKQVFLSVFDVLEKAMAVLGKEELPLDHCQKILSAGLESCQLGMIPPTADCVVVGDLERSRLPEVKYLFILGVNEGILPAAVAPQGIFTEAERQCLVDTGLTLAVSARQKLFQEQFLIYLGLTRPSLGLLLTYPQCDLEGKPLFASSLIDRICRMDFTIKVQEPKPFALQLHTEQTSFHAMSRAIADHTEETPMDPLFQEMYSYYAKNENFKEKLRQLQLGFVPPTGELRLAETLAKQLYGKRVFSSVSRLEQFASCPFSYYMEHNLKAKERPLHQLNVPDLGNLFHSVLEIFSNELVKNSKNWTELSDTEIVEMVHSAVDIAAPNLNNEILFDTASNTYLIERLKRIATTATKTLVQHLQQGDFVPKGYEVGFGMNEALPPIHLPLSDGGELVLSGKIDRVDVLYRNGKEEYLKIIDYKSGKKQFSFQDIYYGLQLQLLVYMDAYLQAVKTEFPDLKPSAAFYFRITDPRLSVGSELSDQEIESQLFEKMKVSGLVLENQDVIEHLDHIFLNGLEGQTSSIIPVGFTKKGTPSSKSILANDEEYEKILHFTKKRAITIGNDLKRGIITPNPYRSGTRTPCDYCKYGAICRYEYEKTPVYRDLEKMPKQKFMEKLEEESAE
ncbi:MAG: helicase-exonuclease AddAB subunit AddB [Bacillota bacterium]